MTNRQPLLTLDGLNPDRPFVRIRGKDYEMRMPDEFGLDDRARLKGWYDRIIEWELAYGEKTIDDLPVDQLAQFSKMMRQFVKAVLIDLPDTLLYTTDRLYLTDRECMVLVTAFGEVVEEQRAQAPTTEPEPSLTTGVS